MCDSPLERGGGVCFCFDKPISETHPFLNSRSFLRVRNRVCVYNARAIQSPNHIKRSLQTSARLVFYSKRGRLPVLLFKRRTLERAMKKINSPYPPAKI